VANNKYKVSKEFLDAWSKNSAERLAEAKAKVDAYSAAYSAASKLVNDYIKATPGDAAVKDLFESQYTPTGPGIKFDNSGAPLVELTKKIKDWNGSLLPTKELKSNRSANEYYAEIQAIIAKSPDDIFMSDSQRIRAKVLSTLPDFKGDLDEEALLSLSVRPIHSEWIVPVSVLLTEYNALTKNLLTAAPTGPVNEAKPTEPTPSASPINAAEKGEKPKAASTLNPEKEATAPVEATTGTVTTAKPEVPKEMTPVKPETGTTVNVTVAPTQPVTPSAPTQPVTPSAPTPPAASPINVEAKKEEKVGGVNSTFLTKLLGKENVEKLASNSSALNESKTRSAIEKSKETIQSTTSTNELTKETNTSSVTSTTSTLNPTDVTKAKPKVDMTALTRLLGKDNVAKLTNTASEKVSSSVVNETKKVGEIIKSAEAAGKETTGKIGGVAAELGAPTLPKETKTSTEITKTAPTLPAAPKPAEKKAELEKTQPMTASKPDAVSLTESKETKGEAASESMGPAAAAQGTSTTTNVDFSGVESRLARIEMLLSGPLDVKIIES
jgi:hypothetical protein